MKKLFGCLLVAVMLSSMAVMAFAEDQIKLRVAWWGSQNRHERTIKVIEMFMKKHPNITISYEPSGWNDHWTKLATQAAGGNLPDVIQQDYARLAEWQSRDLMYPLDEFVESGVLDFSNVADAALAGGRIDGKLYAVNLGTNSHALVLDLDAFEKAGVELPRDDWTWPEFEKIVTELHDKLGIWGMGPGLTNEQFWKSLYLGLGQWAYAKDGKSLGYTDDQPLVDYYNMLIGLQQAGAMPTRAEEVAGNYENQGVESLPIVSGKAAISTFWSNQIVAVQTAAGEDRNLRLIHLPRPEGGQSSNYVKPSQFFSITSQTEHPKEAAMFIDYFTNSIEANEVLFAERGVPISSKVQSALKPMLGKAQLETFEYLARVEKDSSPIPPPDPPGHSDIVHNVWWPEFVDPVCYGQISPEEGVKVLREMATEILAQQ
jgi:multiple sugar transport system substrate-binding protein